MRVLILGGTGLTGPHIVRGLASQGQEVTVFHRGNTAATLPDGAAELLGDASNLTSHRAAFEALRPDVVIGMMTLTRGDAEQFVQVFSGIVGRAIVISSGDVYLAFGRMHRSEPGPLIEGSLSEGSPLRTKVSLGGEGYDKIGVEAVLRGQNALPATIIRYPAVYGPGDHQYRFYDEVRRMADGRPAILMPEPIAALRFSHGYSEDVAKAVVLAALDEKSVGKTYNVAEASTPGQQARVEALARIMDWQGRILLTPESTSDSSEERLKDLPGYNGPPDYRQHMVLDSSRIRTELGYAESVEIEESLRRTIAWLLAHPNPRWKDNYAEEDAILASLGA